jgi:hypothetical protein
MFVEQFSSPITPAHVEEREKCLADVRFRRVPKSKLSPQAALTCEFDQRSFSVREISNLSSLPRSKPSVSHPRQPRPCSRLSHKRPHTKLYDRKWLMNYAMPASSNGYYFKSPQRIIPATRLSKVVSIKWDGNLPLCRALVLPVGHKKRTGEVKIAPKERIDSVNDVWGENGEPSWYDVLITSFLSGQDL